MPVNQFPGYFPAASTAWSATPTAYRRPKRFIPRLNPVAAGGLLSALDCFQVALSAVSENWLEGERQHRFGHRLTAAMRSEIRELFPALAHYIILL
jgi:hypothetical protein